MYTWDSHFICSVFLPFEKRLEFSGALGKMEQETKFTVAKGLKTLSTGSLGSDTDLETGESKIIEVEKWRLCYVKPRVSNLYQHGIPSWEHMTCFTYRRFAETSWYDRYDTPKY